MITLNLSYDPHGWIPIASKDWMCCACKKRGVLEYREEPNDLGGDWVDVYYRCTECGDQTEDVSLRERDE